jgi:hypothetical protein
MNALDAPSQAPATGTPIWKKMGKSSREFLSREASQLVGLPSWRAVLFTLLFSILLTVKTLVYNVDNL